eukprot:scaffold1690_cov366-Prasinococcus_capsulatus_cf.AAC.8
MPRGAPTAGGSATRLRHARGLNSIVQWSRQDLLGPCPGCGGVALGGTGVLALEKGVEGLPPPLAARTGTRRTAAATGARACACAEAASGSDGLPACLHACTHARMQGRTDGRTGVARRGTSERAPDLGGSLVQG